MAAAAHWPELHAESAALAAWLPRVPAAQRLAVVRVATEFTWRNGPFQLWVEFCEATLASGPEPGERSDVLWMLALLAQLAGLPDRALAAAQETAALDRDRLNRGDTGDRQTAAALLCRAQRLGIPEARQFAELLERTGLACD